MKISIVTVCFNSEITIRDAIESVLCQNYPDIEYIIVDGASNDNTMSIVCEYEKRIAKIVSEPDKGIYDAMNKGICLATGDFVGMLNSDDVFASENTVRNLVSFLSENSGLDGAYGDLVYVEPHDINRVTRIYPSMGFYPWKIRFGLIFPHPTLYVKPVLYQRFGYYKLNYRVAADFEFMTRIIVNGAKLGRNPQTMVKMRIGGISNTGFWWRIHQNLEIVRACKENGVYTNIFLIMLKIPFKLVGYLRR